MSMARTTFLSSRLISVACLASPIWLAGACGGRIAPDDRPETGLVEPSVDTGLPPTPDPAPDPTPEPEPEPLPIPDTGTLPDAPALPDTRDTAPPADTTPPPPPTDGSTGPGGPTSCRARPEACGPTTTRQAWAQSVVDACQRTVGSECGQAIFDFDDPDGCVGTIDVTSYSAAFAACLEHHAFTERCSGDVAVPSGVGAKAVRASSCF